MRPDHQARDAGESSTSAPRVEPRDGSAPEQGDDDVPFYNPYMELANVPGETPMFDRDVDDQGNLYVVGEGKYVDCEDGTVQSFPALLTMTPSEQPLPGEDEAFVPTPVAKVNAELASAASELDGGGSIDVVVVVNQDEPGLQAELDRAMAKGSITTREEYGQHRDTLISERQVRVADAIDPVAAEIESRGGTVLSRGTNSAFLSASVSAEELDALAARDDVRQLDLAHRAGESTATADGLAHQHGAQIRQYVQNGWTGEGPTTSTSDDLVVGIIEINEEGPNHDAASFHTVHGAWRDGDDASPRRWAQGVPRGQRPRVPDVQRRHR